MARMTARAPKPDSAVAVLDPDGADVTLAPMSVGAAYRRIASDEELGAMLGDLRTPKRREYLLALAQTGRKHRAIAVADCSWESLSHWRETDPVFAVAEDRILAHCKQARLHAYFDTLDSIALEDRNLLAAFFGLKQADPSFKDNWRPDPPGHQQRHQDGQEAPSITAWKAMLDELGLGEGADLVPDEAAPLLPEHTGDSADSYPDGKEEG